MDPLFSTYIYLYKHSYLVTSSWRTDCNKEYALNDQEWKKKPIPSKNKSLIREQNHKTQPEIQLVRFLKDISSADEGYSGKRSRYVLPKSCAMPIESEDSVPVTMYDGSRWYVPRKGKFDQFVTKISRKEKLLSVSMEQLNLRAHVLQIQANRKKRVQEGTKIMGGQTRTITFL